MDKDEDRETRLQWCASSKVELIELDAKKATKEAEEDEDDEYEQKPMDRIKEVIETTSWSTIRIHVYSNELDTVDQEQFQDSSDGDHDQFEQLFQKLSEFKGKRLFCSFFFEICFKFEFFNFVRTEQADKLEGNAKFEFASDFCMRMFESIKLDGDNELSQGSDSEDSEDFDDFQDCNQN